MGVVVWQFGDILNRCGPAAGGDGRRRRRPGQRQVPAQGQGLGHGGRVCLPPHQGDLGIIIIKLYYNYIVIESMVFQKLILSLYQNHKYYNLINITKS